MADAHVDGRRRKRTGCRRQRWRGTVRRSQLVVFDGLEALSGLLALLFLGPVLLRLFPSPSGRPSSFLHPLLVLVKSQESRGRVSERRDSDGERRLAIGEVDVKIDRKLEGISGKIFLMSQDHRS